MSFQIFGGKILMKWRELNTYYRKYHFKSLIIFVGVLLLIYFVVIAIKSNGQPVKSFWIFPSIILLILSGSWFSPGVSIRLKELCVQSTGCNFNYRSDYSKIERATV